MISYLVNKGTNDYTSEDSAFIPVKKGDKVSYSGPCVKFTFYPIK